jgi:hypothetical protein
MYWVDLFVLFALGVLGASGIILKKKPNAKELIEKLSKYGGWIGVLGAVWGIWTLISALLNLGMLGMGLYALLIWITILATGVCLTGLGIIFGYGMITTYLSAEARAKGEKIRAKLTGYQSGLGILAIIMSIWWVLLILVFVHMF